MIKIFEKNSLKWVRFCGDNLKVISIVLINLHIPSLLDDKMWKLICFVIYLLEFNLCLGGG